MTGSSPRGRSRTSAATGLRSVVLPGRFRAVIFDLDGLLLDSEPAWADAEAILLSRHGLEMTAADRLATRGRSIDGSIMTYGERLGLAQEQLAELRVELVELARVGYAGAVPQDGAIELVRDLAGLVPLGLASNTDRALVEAALAAADIRECFDVVVGADDVVRGKPDPDVYLEVCRHLAVEPTDAIAFEDSTPGLMSASVAGLTCVAVPSDPMVDLGSADFVVASLSEVLLQPTPPAGPVFRASGRWSVSHEARWPPLDREPGGQRIDGV